jgi:hypothetical protein
VYPEDTMHLVNTTVGFSSTLNAHSCLFRATLQENSQITGGTGLFAHCERHLYRHDQPPGAAAPQPDGSCAVGQPSLHEVDTVTFSGTLSF